MSGSVIKRLSIPIFGVLREFVARYVFCSTRDPTDPYLTRHRTGQVERLMACDQIEAKIMKYHTLSGGGMSAVNLAKFNRKILLSSKSN